MPAPGSSGPRTGCVDNSQHTLYRYPYTPPPEQGDTVNESEDYGNNGDARPADSGICGGTP